MRGMEVRQEPLDQAGAPAADGTRPRAGGRARAWLEVGALYLEPRLLVVLALGFASGLPLLLTLSTLSIWLTEEGVTLTAIGLFAMVGTPYAVKFLWAPIIDRVPIPLLTPRLGRRRSWLLAIQACLVMAIVALGATRPGQTAFWTALAALLVSFFSASQDIVVDAYRIEILAEREQGAGAAMTQFGYRIGMLASGAGALLLAEFVPWVWVYAAMAGLLGLIGLGTTLSCREPPVGAAPAPDAGPRGLARLRQAIVEPVAEFVHRNGGRAALLVLAFILLYKFGDAFAGVMANPFYVKTGFTKAEIAAITKIFGLAATLTGVFVGGLLVGRFGVMRALLVCGILQMLSNLLFAVQALAGRDLRVLVLTIGFENLAGGMGSAAFVAYLSVLCNVAYTATQYALFSSFMAVGRTVLSSTSGIIADRVEWVVFFALSTLLALPGLLVLAWMLKYFPTAGRPAAPA